uniref:Uncharacterized protein n=1 Tax=Picea sitchensis TaxID=3332 RepID=D5AC64_PICSI|nr:unknown [Picea sitchensis]
MAICMCSKGVRHVLNFSSWDFHIEEFVQTLQWNVHASVQRSSIGW